MTPITILKNGCIGFGAGYGMGTLIIEGGKFYCKVFTNSDMRVSDVLRHIGTPAFRRQAAVGWSVFLAVDACFQLLKPKLSIQKPLASNLYKISTLSISGALAVLAANSTTHSSYHYTLFGVIVVSIMMIAAHYLPSSTSQMQSRS